MAGLTPPTAAQISAARERAGLSQQQAADLVHVDIRSWRRWELAERGVNMAAWELFLLRSDQHPSDVLKTRAAASGKASDLPVGGFVILDKEMRAWAGARNMHVFYGGSWHVMIGKTWCTPGYETPQKALEACWESGEYEDLDKCKAAGMATSKF